MEGKANREKPNDEQGIGHGNKELIGYQEYWVSRVLGIQWGDKGRDKFVDE